MPPVSGRRLACAVLAAVAAAAAAAAAAPRQKPQPYLDWMTLHREDPSAPERRILVTVVPDPQHDYVRYPVPGSPWSPVPVGTGPPLQPGEMMEETHFDGLPAPRTGPLQPPTQRQQPEQLTQQDPPPQIHPTQQQPQEKTSDSAQQTPALDMNTYDHLNEVDQQQHQSPSWAQNLPPEWFDSHPVVSAFLESWQGGEDRPDQESEQQPQAGGPQPHLPSWLDSLPPEWLAQGPVISGTGGFWPGEGSVLDQASDQPLQQQQQQPQTDRPGNPQLPSWVQNMASPWLQSPLVSSAINSLHGGNRPTTNKPQHQQEQQTDNHQQGQQQENEQQEQQRENIQQEQQEQQQQQQGQQRQGNQQYAEPQDEQQGQQEQQQQEQQQVEQHEQQESQQPEEQQEQQQENRQQSQEQDEQQEQGEQQQQHEGQHEELQEQDGQQDEQQDEQQNGQQNEQQEAAKQDWQQEEGQEDGGEGEEDQQEYEQQTNWQQQGQQEERQKEEGKQDEGQQQEGQENREQEGQKERGQQEYGQQQEAQEEEQQEDEQGQQNAEDEGEQGEEQEEEKQEEQEQQEDRQHDEEQQMQLQEHAPPPPRSRLHQAIFAEAAEDLLSGRPRLASPAETPITKTSMEETTATAETAPPTATTKSASTDPTTSNVLSEAPNTTAKPATKTPAPKPTSSPSEASRDGGSEPAAPSSARRRPGSLLSRLVRPLLTWRHRPSGQRLLRYLADPLNPEHWNRRRRRRRSSSSSDSHAQTSADQHRPDVTNTGPNGADRAGTDHQQSDVTQSTPELPDVSTGQPNITAEMSSVPQLIPEVPDATTEESHTTAEQSDDTRPTLEQSDATGPITELTGVTTEQPEVITEHPDVTPEQNDISQTTPSLADVTTEQSDVSTEQIDITTEQPAIQPTTEQSDVTTQQIDITTEQPVIQPTTEQSDVTTEMIDITTEQPVIQPTTEQSDVTTQQIDITTEQPVIQPTTEQSDVTTEQIDITTEQPVIQPTTEQSDVTTEQPSPTEVTAGTETEATLAQAGTTQAPEETEPTQAPAETNSTTAPTEGGALQSVVVEAAGPGQGQECGVTSDQLTRIVGGVPADPGRWPWMAALLVRTPWLGPWLNCGGVLVTGRHVLTAGHCLYSISQPSSLRSVTVRLGEYRLHSAADGPHVDLRPVSIAIHPAYNHATQQHDVGIITLPYDVTVHTAESSGLKEDIRPICLPPAGADYTGEDGTVIGWGNLHESGYPSFVLHEVTVPIWNQTACRHAYRHDPWGIGPDAFCAGLREGGKDSCQGDSGGPLMVRVGPGHLWTVAGVVSWGEGCARPVYPGVYSNVASMRDWIDSMIR